MGMCETICDYPRNPGESDYDWGYRVGFADVIVQYYWRYYSADFCRGYRDGRNAIEALVQDVCEERYFQ